MDVLRYLLPPLILVSSSSMAAGSGVMLREDPAFVDTLPVNFTALWQNSPVHSVTACALACRIRNGCQGFSYNNGRQTCHVTSSRFLRHGDEYPYAGYRYYRTQQDTCPPDSVLHKSSSTCYQVYTNATSWYNALAACRALGGRLAVLDTQSKTDFVMEYFRNGSVPVRNYFLGAHRPFAVWNSNFPNGIPDHIWLSGVAVDWNYLHTAGYARIIEPNGLNVENILLLATPVDIFVIEDFQHSPATAYLCEFSLI